jgi:DNA segregation ATPase FtsK/SpoIIIE, S-DNA-T family
MPLFSSARSLPLPEKLVALLEDLRSLTLGLLAVYLAIVLMGYQRQDPGWSHVLDAGLIHNPGGLPGAWLADVLFYFFGFSAWWFVLAMVYVIVYGALFPRRYAQHPLVRHSLFVMLIGFLMILCSACGMEALRFYSNTVHLPFFAGGILGYEIGSLMVGMAGYTGGTLLLLGGLLMGASLFFGISILGFVEEVGLWFENIGFRFGLFDRERHSPQAPVRKASKPVRMPKGTARVARERMEPAIQQARKSPPTADNARRPITAGRRQPPTKPPPMAGTVPRPPTAPRR